MDVIIGMDWLSSNDILLDCCKKLVLFSDNLSQKATTSSYLNTIQVEECFYKKVPEFLLHSLKSEVEQDISSIPIVKEFPTEMVSRLTLVRLKQYYIGKDQSLSPRLGVSWD
ncbi:hypothetical protein PIB30_072739 [Stylosanthes scabra]|uniref:Uncharacterized protein n=1 Tax=Stylosanthes scabra TaxID=79078 RepID=A0ABU6XPW3_9FABA|nr:hypothetical protein [Stylosanthes scabra]